MINFAHLYATHSTVRVEAENIHTGAALDTPKLSDKYKKHF